MALKIMPHGRLQEWVAQEKGYFTAEGLEYSFVTNGDYGIGGAPRDSGGEVKTGAFETFEAGRSGANVSCACHWATKHRRARGIRTAHHHRILRGAVCHRRAARVNDPQA
jgi:NitT/TauT family transport system substrate-binding protein